MTEAETKVRPLSLNKAIYKDKDDNKWYWTHSNGYTAHPVGPFRTREDARYDYRKVMGIRKED